MIDPAPRLSNPVARSAAIFAVACLAFGLGLGAEPHFVDESAYIAQSFYADLLIDGRRDDPAWLDYGGYDLPPLPKYAIGIALRVGGHPRPGPSAAAAWYGDTSRRFVPDAALVAARVPSVLFGALGCVAIASIGGRALGTRAGLVAAGLLMVSPLYRLHARRAMSDVPAEACGLVALAFGLAAWSRWVEGRGGWRAWAGMVVGAGVFAGLAVLSKLNGAIAGMVLGAWVVLGLVVGDRKGLLLRRKGVPSPPFARGEVGGASDGMHGRIDEKTGRSHVSRFALAIATILAGVVAFGVFVALNPYLTARPEGPLRPDREAQARLSFVDRVRAVAAHRVAASDGAREAFPNDALSTPGAKLAAVAVQGYGRFAPMGPRHSDSRRRFDPSQDWPVVLWLPIVAAGGIVCGAIGRAQRERGVAPGGWAVLVAAGVAFVAVSAFIPLAWDRYYLSIQPGAILLASSLAELRRPRRGAPS